MLQIGHAHLEAEAGNAAQSLGVAYDLFRYRTGTADYQGTKWGILGIEVGAGDWLPAPFLADTIHLPGVAGEKFIIRPIVGIRYETQGV